MQVGGRGHDHSLLRREVEADESYFGPRHSSRHRGEGVGRGSPAKIPVFGILERGGHVEVTVVADCSAKSLLNATVRAVKRGSLVYTDRWKGYDTLTFCGYRHLRIDPQHTFTDSTGRPIPVLPHGEVIRQLTDLNAAASFLKR